MAKLLKFIAMAVGVLVVLVAVALGAAYVVSNRHLHRSYSIQPAAFALPSSADALARGEHLAVTRGCAVCHGSDLGGAKVIDDPAMGKMYGPNITSGKGSVVLNYQTADWIRTIQHGVTPAGRPLMLMPSEDFAELTNEDLGDLIAYVKSVPAVNRPRVPVVVGPVARVLISLGKLKLAAEKIDHASTHTETITPAVSISYGRYVAVSCIGCHNPSFSGGKIAAGPPDWPPAANLTGGQGGRIKGWSEADFLQAIRTGVQPDGAKISPIMPRVFGQMSDTELKAVFAYIQSLPPKKTGER